MRGTVLALALLTGAAWLQAQNLAGVRAVAAGGNTSFALLSDGTVWTWGNNEYGQLGEGAQLPQRPRWLCGAGRKNSGPRAAARA